VSNTEPSSRRLREVQEVGADEFLGVTAVHLDVLGVFDRPAGWLQ
jgi:hypothetical protein